jgi:hypothetical protein
MLSINFVFVACITFSHANAFFSRLCDACQLLLVYLTCIGQKNIIVVRGRLVLEYKIGILLSLLWPLLWCHTILGFSLCLNCEPAHHNVLASNDFVYLFLNWNADVFRFQQLVMIWSCLWCVIYYSEFTL